MKRYYDGAIHVKRTYGIGDYWTDTKDFIGIAFVCWIILAVAAMMT